MQEALSCLYDTREPHQGLAWIHEILTTVFFEESMLISRSHMLRSAREGEDHLVIEVSFCLLDRSC